MLNMICTISKKNKNAALGQINYICNPENGLPNSTKFVFLQ